jgi:dihydroorotase
VELVARARDEGLHVTAEVTPHHLTITDEWTLGYDTNTKMAPPLRSAADVEACQKGLAEGVIDVIATDHAPHAVHEKEVEFTEAPPGVLGFETAFGVVMELVRKDILTPLELMRRMSTNARHVVDIEGGTLAPGTAGDVVVLDPERVFTYDPAKGYSKSRNSPWVGKELTGRVIATIVDGRLVYHCDRGVPLP